MEATVRVVDGTINLPKAVIQWIGNTRELGMFLEGDTLVLKKVRPAKLSEIAMRVVEEEMPLDEITAEVHRHRREQRDASRR
jgi:hypothetical protein